MFLVHRCTERNTCLGSEALIGNFSHFRVQIVRFSTVMPILSPNRSLLNPKFEGYRLDPVAQADVVTRYELPYKLTQATVSASRSPISMQEVQSRITHNHLAISRHHRRALYIDSELRVVVVDVDQVSQLRLSLLRTF